MTLRDDPNNGCEEDYFSLQMNRKVRNCSLLFPTPAVINMQNSFLRLRILSLSFKIPLTRVTSQSFPETFFRWVSRYVLVQKQ